MKADAKSWKIEPFTVGKPIPLKLEVTKEQFVFINKGSIPEQMEDKWFIYFETPYLFLHRSWTGQPVFKIKFVESKDKYIVDEALYSSDLLDASNNNLDYQAKLAQFLVCNILLGQKIPFPKPPKIDEKIPGILQHHISGTAYPEGLNVPKKKWWQKLL